MVSTEWITRLEGPSRLSALAQSAAVHGLLLAVAVAIGWSGKSLQVGIAQTLQLEFPADENSRLTSQTRPFHTTRRIDPITATETAETAKAADLRSNPDSPSSGTTRDTHSGGTVGDGTTQNVYLSQLLREIARHRRYPRLALLRGLEGTVLLDFSVASDGRIGQVQLRRSSLHEILDEAALRLLRDLERAPPPPADFAAPVRLTLPIVYNLRQSAQG